MEIGLALSPSVSSQGPNPLLAGLVGYYRCANGNDSSPSENHLTVGGTVSFDNDGLAGKCATFDGASHLSISAGSGPNLSIPAANAFCLAALYRVTNNATAVQGVLSKGTAGNREWDLYLNGPNGAVFEIFDGTTTTRRALGDYTGAYSGLPSNNAYILTFAWFDPAAEGANGCAYVQGCKIGDGQTAFNPFNFQALTGARGAPNSGPFEIGARFGSSRLTGRVDSAAVWSGVFLTQAARNLVLARTLAGLEWI
jgi:hypothetical protein